MKNTEDIYYTSTFEEMINRIINSENLTWDAQYIVAEDMRRYSRTETVELTLPRIHLMRIARTAQEMKCSLSAAAAILIDRYIQLEHISNLEAADYYAIRDKET